VATGHRFIGGFIGSHREREEYVVSKVHRWVGHINVLAKAASTQPQLAYAAFTKSQQHNFLPHVVSQCGPLFRILSCHSSLASYWPCLVWKCLQLSNVCLRFLCN